MLSAGSASYSYDANGNRTLSGYQTGKGNELLSDGIWDYTYDTEGNVMTKTNIATGAVWTYGYDLDNQLTSAVEKDSSGNVLQSVTLKYDVFGQLVEEDTTTGGQTTVQRFAYDAEGNVWADLDGNNSLVARRLYADIDGQTQAIARETIAGGSATAAAWYLSDHLGSVRDIQDNASGAVVDHLDYDAYGNLTNEAQPGNGDRFKYAQGTWDATLGLYHFGARWYDPASGRWEEQDPLGLGPDSNDYRYLGNGPTNEFDPSGEDGATVNLAGEVRRYHCGKLIAVSHIAPPPPEQPPRTPIRDWHQWEGRSIEQERLDIQREAIRDGLEMGLNHLTFHLIPSLNNDVNRKIAENEGYAEKNWWSEVGVTAGLNAFGGWLFSKVVVPPPELWPGAAPEPVARPEPAPEIPPAGLSEPAPTNPVPTTPRPGRMHVEPVEVSAGRGRDFVVPGRSRPEMFSARLMDGTNTLEVTWTESLGQGTLVNRLAQAQELAGGPGSFTRITGMASDNLQGLIRSGQFNAEQAAHALGQRLGGRWRVEVTPRPNSTTWDITATRLGD